MNKIQLDKLTIILICLIVIILISFFIFFKSEAKQCLSNPFVYGANKMGDISCSCNQFRGTCPAQFFFNDTAFETPITKCGGAGLIQKINFNESFIIP